MAVVDAFLDPILKAAIEKAKLTKREDTPTDEIGEDETLLDHLIKFTKGNSCGFAFT